MIFKGKTRHFAALLALIMAASLFAPALTAVSAENTVRDIEPVILAETGKKIDLTGYTVEFPDKSAASDITWKNGSSVITEFTPSQKGITALTAEAGGKSRSVYIAAKDSADSEYVLYFNDFDSANAISDWTKSAADSAFTVADGRLKIDGLAATNPRIYLPSWLSEFGNYKITVNATQTDPTDASRWVSIMYRAQSISSGGAPYYHMCVRNNMRNPATATTGGIELCSYTSNWTYYKSASYTESIDAAKDYEFTVAIKDGTVQYSVDGNVVIHFEDLPSVADRDSGAIGLQANSSVLSVDSIKITALEAAPKYDEPAVPKYLQNVASPQSNILNTPTNIALVNSAEALEAVKTGTPASVLVYTDADLNVTTPSGEKLSTAEEIFGIIGDNIIPAFYVKDRESAGAVAAFVAGKEFKDALIISPSAEVIRFVTNSYSFLRTALDYSEQTGKADAAKMFEIRRGTTAAGALIAVLPIEYATQSNVNYLRGLGVTVWALKSGLKSDTDAAFLITSGASGIISDDYKRIETCFTSLFEKNTLTRTPVIIGHRGNPSQAPENSISGYLKAVENGADVVETDVMLSKDGQLIVMHDGTLNRTTNYTGSLTVAQMTLEEIKQYTFKNTDEKVPTLGEMFAALKDVDVKIFLEIKTGDGRVVQPIVDLIKSSGYENRVFIICFDGNQLARLRTIMPDMGTGHLLMIDVPTGTEKLLESVFTNYNVIRSTNSTLNPYLSVISKEYVEALRHRGITVWPWTYNTASAAAFTVAFKYGVDGITTDDAQYTLNTVKELNWSQDDFYMNIGTEYDLTVNSVTYGGKTTDISTGSQTVVKFIYGEDVAKYENGKITALGSGAASFIVGHKTRLPDGSQFILYTQPITVTVQHNLPDASAVPKSFPTGTVAFIAVILLGAVGIGAAVVYKRKK